MLQAKGASARLAYLAHLGRGDRVDLRGVHQRTAVHLVGGEVRVVDELHISEIRAISRSQCWLGDRQAYLLRFYLTQGGRKGLE